MSSDKPEPIDVVCAVLECADTIYPSTRDTFAPPWAVTPREYVNFAHTDLAGGGRRGVVNALGNSKRALECQADSLLLAFHISPKSLNVPKKLETLGRLGIVSPTVLRKINHHRNEMEHDYACPALEVVEDFVGIVELFVESGRIHLEERVLEWTVELPGNQSLSIAINDGVLVVSGAASFSARSPSDAYVRLIGSNIRRYRE